MYILSSVHHDANKNDVDVALAISIYISLSALVVTMFAATFKLVSHYDIKLTTSEFVLSRVC